MIYDWERNQDVIVNRIGSKAIMKVCCKVRDEPLLTEAWIEHHADIVGYENLIIADNMSSDPDMIAILEKFASRVTIFRFGGPHNAIHWHSRFRPLFQAIRDNSRFFSFIDVDERLVHVENDRYKSGREILDKLESLGSDEIIACAWLINSLNSHNRFCISVDGAKGYLGGNLRWGKPILPASLAGAQAGIHNAQYTDFRFSTEAGTGFFFLHLTEFPERRIATNKNKLVSRGVVAEAVTADRILELDFSGREDKSFMPLVDEMKRMKALLDGSRSADTDIYAGHHYVELEANGALRFDDEAKGAEFRAFLADGAPLVDSTFNSGLPQGRALAESLYDKAIATRDTGNETRAEALLTYGMNAFPWLRHRYGGPAFRKELLRMYLSGREWERARQLAPTAPGEFGMHWHCILFARARTVAGHLKEAQFWWNEALRHEPGNGEAQQAVADWAKAHPPATQLEIEPVLQDLQDVRNLMNESRVQAHWFMMKYFQHARLTIDDGYRRLSTLTDVAERIAAERSDPSREPVSGPRIPRILHKVWLTNPDAPSEPLDSYVTAILADAEQLSESGWQVFLWLQDEGLVPTTVARIRQSGSAIEIRRMSDHIPDGSWKVLFERFLADRKFPFAADILRMAILNQYGGFYGDLGVRIKDVATANFVADNFDYSFIFWETMFFQNSFMAMAPQSELARIFMKLANDPYLIPRPLITPVTALTEGQAFSGLMVTAILMSIWRPDIRVFPFAPNRRLLTWSSQQSWYKKEGKYGNTYVPESEPSFFSEEVLAQRGSGPQDVLGS